MDMYTRVACYIMCTCYTMCIHVCKINSNGTIVWATHIIHLCIFNVHVHVYTSTHMHMKVYLDLFQFPLLAESPSSVRGSSDTIDGVEQGSSKY